MKSVVVALSVICCLMGCKSTSTTADAGGIVVNLDGATFDSGAPDMGTSSGCTAARAQLIGSISTISTGNVTILSDTAGVKRIFVDASAGGFGNTTTHPWTFVNLGSGMRIGVSDVTATSSEGWDLAFKRAGIYANDGDGGPGEGGAVFVDKDFDMVTSADVTSAHFQSESFFDSDCNPHVDATGSALTSMNGWYNYNESTHGLAPAAGTWLVRGATGTVYKVQIETYYAFPDGDAGATDGGNYVIKVAAL